MGPENSQKWSLLCLAFSGSSKEFWAPAGPKYGVGMNVDSSQRMEKGDELFAFDVSLGLGTICEDLSVEPARKLVSNLSSKG